MEGNPASFYVAVYVNCRSEVPVGENKIGEVMSRWGAPSGMDKVMTVVSEAPVASGSSGTGPTGHRAGVAG